MPVKSFESMYKLVLELFELELALFELALALFELELALFELSDPPVFKEDNESISSSGERTFDFVSPSIICNPEGSLFCEIVLLNDVLLDFISLTSTFSPSSILKIIFSVVLRFFLFFGFHYLFNIFNIFNIFIN